MKDIVDAIDSRIKNTFFGYYVFVLFSINWSQIFYLLVDNSSVSNRINTFQSSTDIYSLLIFPFLAAATYSLLHPWINYIFMYLCTKPTELKNTLQAQSGHKLIVKQQELENARTQALSSTENELIERARRDVELSEIENKEIRENLKSEIGPLRKERDKYRNTGRAMFMSKTSGAASPQNDEFKQYFDSGKLDDFIKNREMLLTKGRINPSSDKGSSVANAFGLLDTVGDEMVLSHKGRQFFSWWILNES